MSTSGFAVFMKDAADQVGAAAVAVILDEAAAWEFCRRTYGYRATVRPVELAQWPQRESAPQDQTVPSTASPPAPRPDVVDLEKFLRDRKPTDTLTLWRRTALAPHYVGRLPAAGMSASDLLARVLKVFGAGDYGVTCRKEEDSRRALAAAFSVEPLQGESEGARE